MGAEVSNEGNTITAVRDGKTLTMTIGSTEATLTEGGASSAITMDVAPYVDSTTWRTYVPVRFAAQAFGCAVGWDQDNQTAVIVDTEKLLDAALAEHQFTYMEKYLAYNQQFQEGIWDISAQFDGSATMFGAGPLSFQGSMDGTTADSLQMAAAMNLKMDLTAFLDAMSQVAGQASELTAEDQALLDALKSEGMDMEIRADMEKGVMYLTMGGSALEPLDSPPTLGTPLIWPPCTARWVWTTPPSSTPPRPWTPPPCSRPRSRVPTSATRTPLTPLSPRW